MNAYYNENDPHAAQWLRNLIAAGHIAPGEVDERDIRDVVPADLAGFTQCHWFAGIGVWSLALRQAGWPDDRPVWTGSCPCQPFSAAGKGKGIKDARHLWPDWFGLIRECRPPVIFGEQVASPQVIGRANRKDVHELWRIERNLTFLKDRVEGQLSKYMQRLPECCGKGMGKAEAIINIKQSKQIDSRGKSASNSEGVAIQFNCGLGRGKAETWYLRDDRDAIRSGNAERLEHSIVRSNNSRNGLHKREHAIGALCDKCSVWRLGRSADEIDRARGLADTYKQIKRTIQTNRQALEETDGYSWLNIIQVDLEGTHYSIGSCAAPAAGFGAPEIRQRLYWVANTTGERRNGGQNTPRQTGRVGIEANGATGGLADTDDAGSQRRSVRGNRAGERAVGATSVAGGLADTDCTGLQPGRQTAAAPRYRDTSIADGGDDGPELPGPVNGFWGTADWLFCTDGKWRPVRPGTFPLAHGVAGRVGSLCAFGNALVLPQAREFIWAYLAVETEMRAAE